MTTQGLVEAKAPEELQNMLLYCLLKSELINRQSLTYQYLSDLPGVSLTSAAFLRLYRPYKLGTMCPREKRFEAWLKVHAEGKMTMKDCALQILWMLGSLTSPAKVHKDIQFYGSPAFYMLPPSGGKSGV